MKNFYSILDVSPNATKDQIKLQYRKLVRECHPDQFLESHIKQHYEEKLKEINEAYTNVTQTNFTTEPYGTSGVKPRNAQHSYGPLFLGIASLSILMFFIITLLPISAMGLSETTEIIQRAQIEEIIENDLNQPLLPQENLSPINRTSNYIPKSNAYTSKLGTTVHPIDPLRIQAMSKNRK